MTGSSTRWLALAATAAIIAAGAVLSAHADRTPPQSATSVRPDATPSAAASASATQGPAATVAATEPAQPSPDTTAALRVALAYALATTNYSAATIRSAWRRRARLAGDQLRRDLLARPPGRPQVRQLAADDAAQLGAITSSRLEQSPRAGRARVTLQIAERRDTDGQRTRANSRYQAQLTRQPGGWVVTAFTIIPSGGSR